MSDLTAEQFAQRVQDVGLVDFAEFETVWRDFVKGRIVGEEE